MTQRSLLHIALSQHNNSVVLRPGMPAFLRAAVKQPYSSLEAALKQQLTHASCHCKLALQLPLVGYTVLPLSDLSASAPAPTQHLNVSAYLTGPPFGAKP